MLQFPMLTFWREEDLYKLQVAAVARFLRCESEQAVEASIEFARYLCERGLDADNYPLFLEILKGRNPYVIKALLGDQNAFELFKNIQPNAYIVDFCFRMLYQYPPGGASDENLAIIFGILYRTYHSAKEGWALYPLSIEHVNAVGKFLDKSKDQSHPTNRFILDILADIAEYRSINAENPRIDEVSTHAIAIRNAFFDRRKRLESVMPPEILVRKGYEETSIKPRKQRVFTQ